MPIVHALRRTPSPTSFRACKVKGMFDIDHSETVFEVRIDAPIGERPWSVGAIIGPSGSGKSTLARQMFGEGLLAAPEWKGECILDDFPKDQSPDQVTGWLTGVGLSSPKAWLLPHHTLSVGQQFRADLALRLSRGGLIVCDEYTSTVDRTVAKAASVATRKTVDRSPGTQFVAVACHHDIIPWLRPDWVIDLSDHTFRWTEKEGLRRPPIKLSITKGERSDWAQFRHHHYLSGDVSPAAEVYLAWVDLGDGEQHLAGFFSTLPAMGMKGWRRGHRTCVLPDFQGFGIGNRMIEETAEYLWTHRRLRFRATTSAPQLVKHRLKVPHMWRMASGPANRAPAGKNRSNTKQKVAPKTSAGRLTTSWEYIPKELRRASPSSATATPTMSP